MKTDRLIGAVSMAMALALSSGCASSTTFRSTDPEAKIYIDGELRGKGSVQHTDTKTFFSTTSVRIEKPGCAPLNVNVSRGEQFEVGPCIGGVFVLVPFLWVMGYKPEHTFEYACSKL